MKRLCVAAPVVWLLTGTAASPQDPKRFIDEAEARLLTLYVERSRADWVGSTYITHDSETLAAKAAERFIAATVDLAKESVRFDHLQLPDDVARKMKLLKLSLELATPADLHESEELTRIAASMEGAFGKAKYCVEAGKCLELQPDLTRIMANGRNPKELLDAWRGWHDTAAPMRKNFVRYVELANKGARELGFADDGAMWRAKYDMPPEAFSQEVGR